MNVRLNKTKFRGSAAFTLVEVVVAAGLLALMVASLYLGISQTFTTLEAERQDLRATQILIEKFESIRLFTWTQLNTPGFVPSSWTEHYDFQNDKGALYSCTVDFSDYGSLSYSSNMKLVTISVSWTNRYPHTRTLQSLLARDGVQNYAY